MLGKVRELTLDFLNEATQAWVEIEYNRRVHREIGCAPAARLATAPDVLRPSPSSDALRAAFRREVKRRQRQSDGTISLDGVRLEIPSRYRHFRDVVVRYPRWDLSLVDLVDPRGHDPGPPVSLGSGRQCRRSARGGPAAAGGDGERRCGIVR